MPIDVSVGWLFAFIRFYKSASVNRANPASSVCMFGGGILGGWEVVPICAR